MTIDAFAATVQAAGFELHILDGGLRVFGPGGLDPEFLGILWVNRRRVRAFVEVSVSLQLLASHVRPGDVRWKDDFDRLRELRERIGGEGIA